MRLLLRCLAPMRLATSLCMGARRLCRLCRLRRLYRLCRLCRLSRIPPLCHGRSKCQSVAASLRGRRASRRQCTTSCACKCTQSGPTPSVSGDTPAYYTPYYTPAGDIPAGDTPAGDTPAGDTPSGDTPAGDTPAGDRPAGDTSAAPSARMLPIKEPPILTNHRGRPAPLTTRPADDAPR